MFNPFAIQARMMRTALRGLETLDAAGQVIAKRTEMMGDAVRAPMEGDYAELGRMVPEKVEAFSKAGTAIMGPWQDIQTAWLAQAQRMGALAAKGRTPTLSEWMVLGAQNAAFAQDLLDHTSRMGADSLKPIHAGATANARRLKKAKR